MSSNIRVVPDSSVDLKVLDGVDFVTVPLKIMAGPDTWVDDNDLDVNSMLDTLASWRGRSSSSCPSPEDYLQAFGDAKEIICLPISQNMSGSFNSASVAAGDYMEQHPDRKVHVVDTLSTSAPIRMLCEKLQQMILAGDDYDTVVKKIDEEAARTRLLFCLQSVRSLANNGRLSHAVAALVGMLNIRMVARASVKGEAEMLDKARGDKKAVASLVKQMSNMGFDGKRVVICHVRNRSFANSVADAILAQWPGADIEIDVCRGLCSYYAEDGGMLMGFQVV